MLKTERMREPGEWVELNLDMEVHVFMDTAGDDTKREQDIFHKH